MKVKIDVEANKNGSLKIGGYKLSLQLSNDVSVAKSLTESEMKSLLEDITQALGYAPIIEKFGCTVEEAKEIKSAKTATARTASLKWKSATAAAASARVRLSATCSKPL